MNGLVCTHATLLAHLVSSIAKSICKSKILSLVVFFLAHLPQISIVLDIRKVDLVI